MPAQVASREISTVLDDWVGYVRIKPPLENLVQFKTACKAAYDVGDDALPQQRHFEQSLFEGTTELRFINESEDELRQIAQHIAQALTDNHDLTCVVGD